MDHYSVHNCNETDLLNNDHVQCLKAAASIDFSQWLKSPF